MAGTMFGVGANNQVAPLSLSLPHVIVTGFGIGPDQELYVLTLAGGVMKLVPA